MKGDYKTVYSFIIYLVLDVYREIEKFPLFYNDSENKFKHGKTILAVFVYASRNEHTFFLETLRNVHMA